MKPIFLKILLLCSLSVCALVIAQPTSLVINAPDTEHIVWNKLPIVVDLPVGKERLLSFPVPVRLGPCSVHQNTNPNLTSNKLTLYNNAGTLYLTAHEVFSSQRLMVCMPSKETVVYVDVSGKTIADDAPLAIVLQHTVTDKLNIRRQTQPSQRAADQVTLMRYAIQQLYTPQRLLIPNPAIARTPMATRKSVPLFLSANVIAMPIASWRSSNRYVTAIAVKNPIRMAQDLWHKACGQSTQFCLRGNWQAVSFYPRKRLSGQGSPDDTSTVFVLSARPFGVALNASKPYRLAGGR